MNWICALVLFHGAAVASVSLPVVFEPNRGQCDESVKFLARANGYTMLLTATGMALSIPGRAAAIRMSLAGANPDPRIDGLDELPGKSNYFIGGDPAKWRTHVPQYARLRYRNVYPGVDLVYYRNKQDIEHDFVVGPGADPSRIRFQVTDADKVELNVQGDLVIHVASGKMRLRKPRIYQEVDGRRREIAGAYRLLAAGTMSFALGPYNAAKPLVIDPVLVYSTYLGGNGDDRALQIEVDSTGMYIFGQTGSTDFPATSWPLQPRLRGGVDAFVAKLSLDGSTLIYATYLGGSGNDDPFVAAGLSVDRQGSAVICSRTNSRDFPLVHPFQAVYGGGAADGFVAKLSPDGSSLVYSTYLGGSNRDQAEVIATDASGNAYVSGATSSLNFPTKHPLQPAYGGGAADAFVTKIDPRGKIIYSTFLGGGATDDWTAIAVDAAGHALVAGRTNSKDFPNSAAFRPSYAGGEFDVFVAKLSVSGRSLAFSAYAGGSGRDEPRWIKAGPDGHVYVSGVTTSKDFPTLNPIQASYGGGRWDGFVFKMQADGSGLIHSTYLGGSGDDRVLNFNLDRFGQLYLAGVTDSQNFPTANPIQASFRGGRFDAYLAQVSADGRNLLFSTYFGGSGEDRAFEVEFDAGGYVYVVGQTDSNDFPTSHPLQASNAGGFDAWIAKFAPGVNGTSSAARTAPPAHGARVP